MGHTFTVCCTALLSKFVNVVSTVKNCFYKGCRFAVFLFFLTCGTWPKKTNNTPTEKRPTCIFHHIKIHVSEIIKKLNLKNKIEKSMGWPTTPFCKTLKNCKRMLLTQKFIQIFVPFFFLLSSLLLLHIFYSEFAAHYIFPEEKIVIYAIQVGGNISLRNKKLYATFL